MKNEADVFDARWLSGVSEASKSELKRLTEFQNFDVGDIIYALGGPQKWLWAIVDGQVQIRVAFIETEPVLAHMYHAGAWFGESELIHGIDGLIEVKATVPTKVARIAYTPFRRIADERPELWRAFALLASMNQLLAMSAANDLTLTKPKQRIAATLLRLSGQRGNIQGSGSADEIRASQQDIANLANIARSKASIHLRSLATSGLIETNYNRFKLLDHKGLTKLIDE
ncbi:Crp/Fnr family transcriptional regulator [Ruegeria sp. HKCCE4150]|uniref:Crp/Fnr family transcriptional regulator n=1 Tax=Ruegeria sp. HKCCE4150 TaxID=2794828 RepID=UPI001AE27E10|nr:Crp/Fnr family transcriptional regulator [Ruegeria sp. HKCCE4150]